jgi:hypothetical protein
MESAKIVLVRDSDVDEIQFVQLLNYLLIGVGSSVRDIKLERIESPPVNHLRTLSPQYLLVCIPQRALQSDMTLCAVLEAYATLHPVVHRLIFLAMQAPPSFRTVNIVNDAELLAVPDPKLDGDGFINAIREIGEIVSVPFPFERRDPLSSTELLKAYSIGLQEPDLQLQFAADVPPESMTTFLSAIADFYRASGGVGFRLILNCTSQESQRYRLSASTLMSVLRIKALLPWDWRGRPGEVALDTLRKLADVAERQPRAVRDQTRRANEGVASSKQAQAILNYSTREESQIDLELKKRTFEHSVRQEHAKTSTDEASAEISQKRILQGRLVLYAKILELGLTVDRPVTAPFRVRLSSLIESTKMNALIAEAGTCS